VGVGVKEGVAKLDVFWKNLNIVIKTPNLLLLGCQKVKFVL